MSFTKNGIERLTNGDDYLFIDKHRDGFSGASKWTIIYQLEFQIADFGTINYREECASDSKLAQAYNFYKHGGHLQFVGVDKDNNQVKLGKFVLTKTGLWHGYPTDYWDNTQDKPKKETLEKMMNNNLIDKNQMKKIRRGKKGI